MDVGLRLTKVVLFPWSLPSAYGQSRDKMKMQLAAFLQSILTRSSSPSLALGCYLFTMKMECSGFGGVVQKRNGI